MDPKSSGFTDGMLLFQNTKTFFLHFLKLMWAIFVASLPGCFCNYVIKNWKTRRYWQAQLDGGIRLAGLPQCVSRLFWFIVRIWFMGFWIGAQLFTAQITSSPILRGPLWLLRSPNRRWIFTGDSPLVRLCFVVGGRLYWWEHFFAQKVPFYGHPANHDVLEDAFVGSQSYVFYVHSCRITSRTGLHFAFFREGASGFVWWFLLLLFLIFIFNHGLQEAHFGQFLGGFSQSF